MSKETSVILLGIFVVLLPYIGIPGSWRTLFFVLFGLSIATVGFLMRGERLSRGGKRSAKLPFVENGSEYSASKAPLSTVEQEHLDHESEGINSFN